MPDTKDDRALPVGRTHRGDASPPITTPEAVAASLAFDARHARAGAVDLTVYFVVKGIDNPILQASMRAWPGVPRAATIEVFDEIFVGHHEVPAPKTAEGTTP
jgi:hypothetical protein